MHDVQEADQARDGTESARCDRKKIILVRVAWGAISLDQAPRPTSLGN